MRVIGLTGGIGSGKSKILKILKAEYQAHIIQADEVARQLQEPGQEGFNKLVDAFGTTILDAAGMIDRRSLAGLIFDSRSARETVNAMIHPLTWNQIREQVQASLADLIVVEAAILDPAAADIYDELWYVFTDKELRINRLARTRGYTRERSLTIMAAQATDEEFRQAADWVIDNNGSIEELKKQLQTRLKR